MPPQTRKPIPESSQYRQISEDGVIPVIADHDGPKPLAGFAHRAMPALAQLQLDCRQSRPHPLCHCATLYLELALRGLSTDVRQP
jgi:hypothetical protein